MAKQLMKGNEAIAEAAIHAGCDAFFGYPITPQNEIPEYFAKRMPEVGGVFVQSESEISAINMVYGAAAAGKRVMTSSSSPGIALKQEGISYLAGARLPAVIVSISRGGPGLGGILPSQSDYFQATRGGGNGDYYIPVYAPASIQEATDLVQKAFNIAMKYRTPVFVLGDGMLAQMMEPVEIRDIPQEEDDISWAANGESGERGHKNVVTSVFLSGPVLEAHNIALQEVYEEIKAKECMYELDVEEGDEILVIAYGTPSRIARGAIAELEKSGIKAGLLRPITLKPFPYEAFDNLPKSVKAVISVELSAGQMIEDIKLGVAGRLPVHFYGRLGGMIFEPEEIAAYITKILRGENNA